MNFKKLEAIRKLRKISQADLARKAGISEAGYTKILSTQNTTIKTYESICMALGIHPADLFNDDKTADQTALLKYGNCPDCNKLTNELETCRRTVENLNTLIDSLKKKASKKK